MSVRRRLEDRIAKASARAEVSGQPSVVTLAARAELIDPLALVLEMGPPFAYWEVPVRGFAVAALGEELTIAPEPGPGRLIDGSAALHDLVARTHQVALDDVDRTPLLIGGFSFYPDRGWPGFPPGRMVLPKLTLIRRSQEDRVWVAATKITGDSYPAEQAASLINRIGWAVALNLDQIEPQVPVRRQNATVDLRDPAFLDRATAAVRRVRESDLKKVTLARQLEISYRPKPGPLLSALRQVHPTCAVFAFARPDGSIFCGATPELLARVEGVKVSALALAGTAPRGKSPTEDRMVADRLIKDPKELEEHSHVHTEIRRRLAEGGFALDPPAETEVLQLAGLQHLVTPVGAVAPVGTNVLDLVGALHPTPAVAGLPRNQALEWIEENEGFDRGWYAGPIGYCDLSGNGEFHVALRSCLIEADRTRVFAGVGIVAGSSPERELAETNLKLDAVLSSLHGINDHRWRTYAAAGSLAAAIGASSVEGIVISPGSRSTPLALALGSGGLRLWTVVDERSAGFIALGMAKASGKPAVLVCTSGTAAANYLPAVAEADRARVPLVVLTADRPPGSLDRDAPQTIDQIDLYGSRVRAVSNLPVAHECVPHQVIEETLRVLQAAVAPNAGPVHINVPFAKPLEPPPGGQSRSKVLPAIKDPMPTVHPGSMERLGRFMEGSERGVIVVGPRTTDQAERMAIGRLSEEAGWPILADALSGMRTLNHPNLITTGDLLLRDPAFAGEKSPDAVIRIGSVPTGATTQGWLAALEVPEAFLDPDFRWTAPGLELVIRDPISSLLDGVSPKAIQPEWAASWRAAEAVARRRRIVERSQYPDTELAVAAALLDSEPVVWVASSLAVRHVDVMMEPGCEAVVLGNRGACGIDGTIASAVGAALALRRRVTTLVGDLAFLHDIGSLASAP